MSLLKYRIYPSLLDKFQKFLDADKEFEDFWNIDSEGNYKRSLEEISDELEQALLDAVNRVPHEPIEAADKGTVFNELVDAMIHGEALNGETIEYTDYNNEIKYAIKVERNGFTFIYDKELIVEAASYFTTEAISQYRTSAVLNTHYGDVELYGVIDEIVKNEVLDIKTTNSYSFGKFEKAWQRFVYPFCLVESGDMESVSQFEFTVFKWNNPKGMPLDAEIHSEVYTYIHETATMKLKSICERFIEWLEANRDRITDPKIFVE